MTITIKGKDKYLQLLRKELREEGINPSTSFSEDLTMAKLYTTSKDIDFYIHAPSENIKLNANLPSHRKHFINKAKGVINGSS